MKVRDRYLEALSGRGDDGVSPRSLSPGRFKELLRGEGERGLSVVLLGIDRLRFLLATLGVEANIPI